MASRKRITPMVKTVLLVGSGVLAMRRAKRSAKDVERLDSRCQVMGICRQNFEHLVSAREKSDEPYSELRSVGNTVLMVWINYRIHQTHARLENAKMEKSVHEDAGADMLRLIGDAMSASFGGCEFEDGDICPDCAEEAHGETMH